MAKNDEGGWNGKKWIEMGQDNLHECAYERGIACSNQDGQFAVVTKGVLLVVARTVNLQLCKRGDLCAWMQRCSIQL